MMIWWEEALVIDDRLVPLRGHLDEEVCDLVLILLQIYIYIHISICKPNIWNAIIFIF